MITSRKNLKDKKFRRGLIFYLAALLFVLTVGALVLLLFPQKTKHIDPSLSNPPGTSTTASVNIDNSGVQIPVLMYHYIRVVTDPNDTVGKNLSVTPETFKQQISWLSTNGYESVGFDDALKIFNNEEPASKKPIIITFDDGYDNAYSEAMPTLKYYGQKGVFYIISGFLGRSEFLTANQVKEISVGGMIIGDHTVSHIDLSTSNNKDAQSQIINSKTALESITDNQVLDFAYPSGKYTAETITILKNLGFRSAVTTKSGIWKQGDSQYEIPRVRMVETTDLSKVLK